MFMVAFDEQVKSTTPNRTQTGVSCLN